VTTAHGVQTGAWLLIAIPALSAAILLLGGKRTNKWGHWLGALVPVGLFVYAVILFFSVKGQSDREINKNYYTWIPVGTFHVDFGILLDPLSMVFVLLITGVGGLIHIYAVGYMAGDPGRRRFFGCSTCSSPRCCCSSWATTSCRCTSAGKAWVSRRTC
jgi:NADH-quinone oxidoreductase subunit L